MISSKERRIVTCFIDVPKREAVEELTGALMGWPCMNIFPRFVKWRGGRIVYATAFREGHEVNAEFGTVLVDGKERRFLTFGLVFVVLPEERVVVSVTPTVGGIQTCLRSNRNSAAFFREWK